MRVIRVVKFRLVQAVDVAVLPVIFIIIAGLFAKPNLAISLINKSTSWFL